MSWICVVLISTYDLFSSFGVFFPFMLIFTFHLLLYSYSHIKYLLKKNLLSTYYVPSTILNIKNTM